MTGDPARPLTRAQAASRSVRAGLDALDAALEEAVEGGLQTGPHTGATRHFHRPGRPLRLATDAELRVFVLARIERLSFDRIAAEIAEEFPPDRRVSRSSLHRWWHRHGRHVEIPNRL